MATKASEIIKLAQSWIGKKESDGSHKKIVDIYNSHKPLARGYVVKYTDSWCATTISALAISLGATDIIPTECSCQQMIKLFKNLGCWIENENRTPSAGEIIFYDWQDSGNGDNQGWSDHVGIVESVSNGKITVIEGNYSNSVKRRTLNVNGKYIRGYGVPKYEPESTQVTHTITEYYPKYTGASVSIVAALKSLGITSTFTYRKKIATANGISNYTGTAAQNTKMLNLLKTGTLVKA